MGHGDENGHIRKGLQILYRVFYPVSLFLIFAVAGKHRFAAQILILPAAILYVMSYWKNTMRTALIVCAVAIASLFSPLDICTPYDRGLSYTAGTVRVRPLVLGLPTKDIWEQAKRGEVVVGGCIVSGLDPKYVITW